MRVAACLAAAGVALPAAAADPLPGLTAVDAPWPAWAAWALAGAAGALGAGAVCALLAWRLLAPLRALAGTARAVAAGDAQARAPLQGPRRLQRLVQTFNDMLDVKQSVESALAESEARFRTLSALSSDWYWEQDAEFRFVSISESIVDHAGFTREQHLGRRRWELPSPDMDDAAWAAHRALLERHEPFHDFEIVRPGLDGERRHVLVSGVPLFDAQGRFTGYRGVGRDITRQRRDEHALAEREQRHRRLIDHLPVGVVVHGADGRVRLFNAEACRVLGLDAQQLGQGTRPPGWQLVDEQGVPLAPSQQPVPRVRDSGSAVSAQVLGVACADAELRWAMVNAFAEHAADGTLESVVEVMVDITARRQAEALQHQRETAEAASRAKSEFVSRMSHELRTPLNAVIGFADVLRADPVLRTHARAQRQLGHVRQAGAHLLALVNDLLDIARIEGRALRVRCEPVALGPLLEECAALHAPAARAAEVELVAPEADTAPVAQADPGRLRQVLHNLVTNAIKYNRRGGQVRLTAGREGERVHVDVCDTGPGLGPEQRAQLFQPFNRLGAEQLGVEGTGLGLLIARELAQAMGGELQVEGEVGVGSIFRLWLPAAADRPTPMAADPATTAPAAPPSRALQVLCVDPDEPGRELLCEAFAAWPHCTVLTVCDVDAAMDASVRQRPDLVLIDLGLRADGALALLRRLAEHFDVRRPPCIALSARVSDADRRAALGQGFDAWLGKPYDVPQLLQQVRELTHDLMR